MIARSPRPRHRPYPASGGRLSKPLGRRSAIVAGVLLLAASTASFDATAASTSNTPAFTASKVVTRINYNNGVDVTADSRKVTVTVSQTQDLRDRQGITVTWSGAHPTGGLANDDTSAAAAFEEYPVVVMECRGTDSTSVPVSKQVSPETCWTQTPAERFGFSSTFLYPAFRMDRDDTEAERGYNANQPADVPSTCPEFAVTHWVPYLAANGTSYPGGSSGCAGAAPEESVGTASLQPGSTTYGAADRNGNGSTEFIVQSDLSNASIGCNVTTACTLEVIPIEGISCDPAGTAPAPGGMDPADRPTGPVISLITSRCEDTGTYAPGSLNASGQPDYSSTTGQYWWSASNWNNRIAVPLTFAQSSDVCNSVTNQPNVLVYGAESMAQATQQWAPALCLNPKLFTLRHVQSSEPEAKNLLATNNIEAAFQAAPPDTPFTTPTVQAPTAVTGWAIAAIVDGPDGKQYPEVRLDARLLAKLLTESYEACALDCLHFPALASNPSDITRDPEFQALNPGIPPTAAYTAAASALSFISADSDVMTALTSYINDDPEARSWLDGNPDPWGMVVNPAYEGIQLPVSRWPLLDTHVATSFGDNNPCVSAPGSAAWLPLVASPLEDPALIAQNMQYGIDNSQVSCANQGQPTQKLVSVGREDPGQQFLLGVVSLADAERYQLPTAALETQRTSDSKIVFSDATGRSFVAPTNASLTAAAKMLEPSDSLGTWTVPYDKMRTTTEGLAAYPGILLISTDVPTEGLPATDAKEYSELLNFAVGPGQTPGIGNGDLPAGYVPMTSANGMAGLVAYTKAAVKDVKAQQCVVPHPSGAPAAAPSCNLPKPPSSPTSSASAATSSGNTTSTTTATAPAIVVPPVPSSSTSTSPSSKPSTTPSSPAASSASAPALARTGKTTAYKPGFGGLVFPIAALIALSGFAFSTLGRRRAH